MPCMAKVASISYHFRCVSPWLHSGKLGLLLSLPPMSNLCYRYEQDRATILQLRDPVNAATVAQLRAQINLVPLRGAMIVDLSGVSFLDSMGIGLLIGLQKRCYSQGQRFLLCEIRSQPLGVLQLCSLERVFSIYGSCQQALDALCPP